MTLQHFSSGWDLSLSNWVSLYDTVLADRICKKIYSQESLIPKNGIVKVAPMILFKVLWCCIFESHFNILYNVCRMKGPTFLNRFSNPVAKHKDFLWCHRKLAVTTYKQFFLVTVTQKDVNFQHSPKKSTFICKWKTNCCLVLLIAPKGIFNSFHS